MTKLCSCLDSDRTTQTKNRRQDRGSPGQHQAGQPFAGSELAMARTQGQELPGKVLALGGVPIHAVFISSEVLHRHDHTCPRLRQWFESECI